MEKPVIIGIAGGTGSGKTTVVQEILRALGDQDVLVIYHDSYYRDRGHLPFEERARLNFDHPDALETELLAEHLASLQAGQAVDVPVYDFGSHTRKPERIHALPRPVIIVEGILVLADTRLRQAMDIKVFVETDADVRFIRRLQRDVQERGRTVASVIDQYLATVRPMHLEFVEPSKRYADIIIPIGGCNAVGIDMLVTKIRSCLRKGAQPPAPAV